MINQRHHDIINKIKEETQQLDKYVDNYCKTIDKLTNHLESLIRKNLVRLCT